MKAKVILKSWFADENISATEVVNLDEDGCFTPSTLTKAKSQDYQIYLVIVFRLFLSMLTRLLRDFN